MYLYLVFVFFFPQVLVMEEIVQKNAESVYPFKKASWWNLERLVNMQKILNYMSLRIRVKEGEP